MRNAAETRIFEFGGFHLDAATRQLSGPDGVIEVPARAFDVLLYMVAHRGELLDKTRLLKAVWPTTAVEEGNLSQCIFALRRAFGDTATEPRFIATVSGRGYQFIAQVRESSAVITPPGRARPRFMGRFYMGIGLVTVALFAVFRFWPASTESEPSTVSSPFVPASLAVLPFTDLSSTKDMEYFADGIAQELMSSLSKVRGLHIVSGHSSFAFKGKTDDARSIGERLHAETILEGSIRKESDRIRITVQLTRTNDGLSLWAETYDRQFDDVLDIQGSIASEVAKALAPVLQRDSNSGQIQSSESTLTHDAQAYRAYLRGVYLLTRWIDRDPQSARVEFLSAVERDPLFARAYAMLARTYEVSANLKIGDVAQNKSLASSALNKALQLDPSIGDLWWVRLMFVAGDDAPIAIRARDLERTIAANPTEIEPMVWLAHIYIVLARRDDALQMFERAYTTDPLSPLALWKSAWFGYAFKGNRQRFLDRTDELDRLLPNDPKPNQIRAWLAANEGRALDWDRLEARAIEVDPTNQANHCYLSADYQYLGGVYDAAMYHAQVCSKLDPKSVLGLARTASILLSAGDVAAARAAVRDALALKPDDVSAQLVQGELQYFTGDCAGAVRTIAQAQPAFSKPEGVLDLWHNGGVETYIWCLRQQGNTARAAELSRVWYAQSGPVTAGLGESAFARMAAATGDRNALVAQLRALSKTKSMDFTFVRHEPMIRPYLRDPEVVAVLDQLEERRAQWRKLLPKSSMRVPIPGINTAEIAATSGRRESQPVSVH